ncbi:MAG: transposase [Caldilineaceae bacterium]
MPVIVAFIGLDRSRILVALAIKHPGISKMGDSELRRLLYMGALGAISGNNPLRTFYRRLLDRGKAKSCTRCRCSQTPGLGLDSFLSPISMES